MRKLTMLERALQVLDDKKYKHMSVREKLQLFREKQHEMFQVLSSQLSYEELLGNHMAQELSIFGLFLTEYLKGRSHVYHIAENFGAHLNKTPIDIPTSLLPNKVGKPYLLEFPDSVKFKDGKNSWRHVIVSFGVSQDGTLPMFIEDPEEIRRIEESSDKPRTLQIVAPDFDLEGRNTEIASVMCMELLPGESISASIDHFIANYDLVLFPREMLHFIAKCLLYIESGDPDLKMVRPDIKTTNPKKLRAYAKKECLVDHMVVGYGFHGREYRVAEGPRVGHFRWQRFGPGMQQVKLIWINETTVRYGLGKTKHALHPPRGQDAQESSPA